MKIGVLVNFDQNVKEELQKVKDFGLTSCQLVSWAPNSIDKELCTTAKNFAAELGVEISLFWCGYSGSAVWDYVDGPSTIGLMPPATRAQRTEELKRGVDIARWLGIKDMASHVGFLSPNPKDTDYIGVVSSIKEIAEYGLSEGINFNFETGQETPMVLRRCIEEVGLPNLGINLDPANLLMYGNGNPVDAIDVFGKYVRHIHAKDGEYPINGTELGVEKAIGEGRVNFPLLVGKLKEIGYDGTLTIEREISGEQQNIDIKNAIEFLSTLI